MRPFIIAAALVLSATAANAMCNYSVYPAVCDSGSAPRNYFPSIGMAPPPQPIQTPYIQPVPQPRNWTVIETPGFGGSNIYHGYER